MDVRAKGNLGDSRVVRDEVVKVWGLQGTKLFIWELGNIVLHKWPTRSEGNFNY